MEHILETVISTLYLDITNANIIISMIPFTYAISIYHNTLLNKYKYICVLGFIVSLSITAWTYFFLPVPPESRTLLVGAYVFIVMFLAAMFWGSAIWLVFRYIYLRKLSPSDK